MKNHDEIRAWYYSKKNGQIYGHMYGVKEVITGGINGTYYEKTKIISIDKKDLELGLDCFYHRWGWPGPDIAEYRFEDYGKTWAFSKKELEK